MSHIVKGKVEVAYNNPALLVKALTTLGIVAENERLYRVGVGYTNEKYPLVLIDSDNPQHRIGYKERNGVWEQYQENYGSYGQWTQKTASAIQDRYLAFHYEKQLLDEGFSVKISQLQDGSLELVAEEATW